MKFKFLVPLIVVLFAACQDKNPLSVKDCSKSSLGFTPLNDLGAGTYQGQQGGLYPRRSNTMPSSHLDLGKSLAAQVQPLGANGAPDGLNGKIVLNSIGVSNISQNRRF